MRSEFHWEPLRVPLPRRRTVSGMLKSRFYKKEPKLPTLPLPLSSPLPSPTVPVTLTHRKCSTTLELKIMFYYYLFVAPSVYAHTPRRNKRAPFYDKTLSLLNSENYFQWYFIIFLESKISDRFERSTNSVAGNTHVSDFIYLWKEKKVFILSGASTPINTHEWVQQHP